ncbi:MAG: cell wall metabolism sensor histidine kinase WalK [Cyanobacteria bacterium REEB67]|nr:cell wall metabolism sensor histidine kinase WalK [Cyanobacteria bacterium REEB67]
MRRRISLSTQLLILLTVPLVFQLGLLGTLASLQKQAELQGEKALHAQRVSEAINALSKDIYEVITGFTDTKYSGPDADNTASFIEMGRRLHGDFDAVEKLTRADAAQNQIVRRCRAAGESAMTQMISTQTFINTGGEVPREDRKLFWHKMREYIRVAISKDLIDIGKSEAAIYNKNPELQAAYRQQVQNLLLVGGAINVLLALALAVYLTRSITDRLKLVNDNAYRLAMGRDLNPRLKGGDEIAGLDLAFHKMAAELKEASRKQGAIIENAQDMICSLEENGTFVEVNPACETILGYDTDELVGKHFIDLIAEADRKRALEFMKHLRRGTNLKPLEMQILQRRHAAENYIDVLWSAHWSKEEETFFCVIHDITDRRQAERMKQEVMAMITHDLRTPLTTIQNFLEFLNDGMYGDVSEKGRKNLYLAQRNSDRMITLINDLLDIEKIKSGMMELELAPTELARSFQFCHELHSAAADQNKVTMRFYNTDLVVMADEERLTRVLSNLVSNALKFSPGGSTLTIWAEKKEAMAVITVQDQGPGVPADMLESVFDRFQQVRGQARTKAGAHSGSGLGLAICKAIVELHGGKIWLQSEEGKGSAFTFSLPLEKNIVQADQRA